MGFTETKEVAELILADERIDVNATDDSGHGTILHHICEDTYGFTEEQIVETFDFLLHSPKIVYPNEGHSPLHSACSYGHEARVETILKVAKEKGIDINQRNQRGRTPLHYAFMGGFEKPTNQGIPDMAPTMDLMLKYAKDLGIDLEATDDKGMTPLHYLYEENHHENVRSFLKLVKEKYKIEFNHEATNEDGKTPPELSRDW